MYVDIHYVTYFIANILRVYSSIKYIRNCYFTEDSKYCRIAVSKRITLYKQRTTKAIVCIQKDTSKVTFDTLRVKCVVD